MNSSYLVKDHQPAKSRHEICQRHLLPARSSDASGVNL